MTIQNKKISIQKIHMSERKYRMIIQNYGKCIKGEYLKDR